MRRDDKVPPRLKPCASAASDQILRLTRDMLLQILQEPVVCYRDIGIFLQKPAHCGIENSSIQDSQVFPQPVENQIQPGSKPEVMDRGDRTPHFRC